MFEEADFADDPSRTFFSAIKRLYLFWSFLREALYSLPFTDLDRNGAAASGRGMRWPRSRSEDRTARLPRGQPPPRASRAPAAAHSADRLPSGAPRGCALATPRWEQSGLR